MTTTAVFPLKKCVAEKWARRPRVAAVAKKERLSPCVVKALAEVGEVFLCNHPDVRYHELIQREAERRLGKKVRIAFLPLSKAKRRQSFFELKVEIDRRKPHCMFMQYFEVTRP